MIFVTGPLFAGKREYIRRTLGLSQEEFTRKAVWDVQELAAEVPDLSILAEKLSQKEIVVATETGGWPVCWPGGRTRWSGCTAACPRC